MSNNVIWHPEVYHRFMGPMRFFFISSFFFKNFHQRVDDLVEGWGLTKFSRDVLIGSVDILLRAHYQEIRQVIPLDLRINDALGGVGTVKTFFVDKAYVFGGYPVREMEPIALDLFTGDELKEFQQNPNNEGLKERLLETHIMLGWEKDDAKTESVTCIEFVAPAVGMIKDTAERILAGTVEVNSLKKYLVGFYSGRGYGSIVLEWSTSDRELIWDLVGEELHDKLALLPSRTDTFIVATHTPHACFHYCQFAPENMLDVARKLANQFPRIEHVPLEKQFEISRLWHSCRRWESKPDQFVRRLIGAMVLEDLSGQRYVIQEIADKLEPALKKHIREKAEKVWGNDWRKELSQQHVPEKDRPLERWTLGSLAEAAGNISKQARDKQIKDIVTQAESNTLREFTKLRNRCVHSADLSEEELQNLPYDIATGFEAIVPLYYRLLEET